MKSGVLPGGPKRNDRGSGTMLAVAIIGVLFAILTLSLSYTAVSSARHRAESAADFAALAGADAARGLKTGEPCTVARQVTEQNSAVLEQCFQDAETVQVETSVPVTAWGRVRAEARAGPG